MRTIDLDGPPDPPAPPGNALEACDRALIDILTALPRNPDTWAAGIETCEPVSPPAGLDTAGYLEWLRETRHLIGSGLPPARQAVEVTAVPNGAELIAAIMQALPKEAS